MDHSEKVVVLLAEAARGGLSHLRSVIDLYRAGLRDVIRRTGDSMGERAIQSPNAIAKSTNRSIQSEIAKSINQKFSLFRNNHRAGETAHREYCAGVTVGAAHRTIGAGTATRTIIRGAKRHRQVGADTAAERAGVKFEPGR